MFAGGSVIDGQNLAFVDIWNSYTNIWTTSNLLHPKSFHAATTIGKYALFGGGPDASVDFGTVKPANGQHNGSLQQEMVLWPPVLVGSPYLLEEVIQT